MKICHSNFCTTRISEVFYRVKNVGTYKERLLNWTNFSLIKTKELSLSSSMLHIKALEGAEKLAGA